MSDTLKEHYKEGEVTVTPDFVRIYAVSGYLFIGRDGAAIFRSTPVLDAVRNTYQQVVCSTEDLFKALQHLRK